MGETADLNDSTVTLHSVQRKTVPVTYCSRKERLLSRVVSVWVAFGMRECPFRENLTGGMGCLFLGKLRYIYIYTSSCEIVCKMTRRASVLQPARLRKLR